MVKNFPIAASRSILKRWRGGGRTAENLPFYLSEFEQEELFPRPYSPVVPSLRAQSLYGSSSSDQPWPVGCRYTIKRGPNAGMNCSKRPLSGDYCRQHRNSIPFVMLPPPQAAVSPCLNRSLPVSHQCQALTLKGLDCPFKALPHSPYCKRHLKYMGDNQRSSLLLPRDDELRFPQASSPCMASSLVPSPQHDRSLDPHQKTSSFAEDEALFPICRHCKIIALRNCNLCQSYGCKMRALSVVQEAIDLGHSRITPLIEDRPTTSYSEPSSGLGRHKGRKTLTLSDILPKLKVCRPSDFGMPAIIPIRTNFYVWDHWWHVKESHLGPHAGMGLFTVHSIPKGQDLFPYIGPEYDKATYHQIETVLPEIRYYSLLYLDHTVQPSREVWIDGGIRHSNLAGYINSVDTEKGCRKRANVEWELRENRSQRGIPKNVLNFIMTVSTRPISAGEELYTTYDWQGACKIVQQLRDRVRGGAAVPDCSPDKSDFSSDKPGGKKRFRYGSR